jgi:dihydrofolate synthase/folylpolyglutamate synthase
MNTKYLNVLNRLYRTNLFKKTKVDLENIKLACRLFNNPQNEIKYIHVAGTNGKGSVCKKLSSVLINSGMKTGQFISPHISTFRERIQINNKMIEKEYVSEELERIYDTIDKNNVDLSYFELVTLLCFNYFRDNKIDIGVLEVGLGGLLDATNVVDPMLSIITSIGMDHMDSLGYTKESIAWNKAGIIKPNRPSIIGTDCLPREVFIKKADEVKSELFQLEESNNQIIKDFEKENNSIIIKSIEILKKYYPNYFTKITEENIKFGLNQNQPCRLENVFDTINKNTLSKLLNKDLSKIEKIYLDVGHNSHALEKVLSSLKDSHIKYKLRVICGFSSNKDKSEMLKIIFSYADKVHLVSSNHPRITTYDDLVKEVNDILLNFDYDRRLIGWNKYSNGNINRTILDAIDECNETDEIILICGSFFIMKDVRKSLGYKDEEDPVELNEVNTIKFK